MIDAIKSNDAPVAASQPAAESCRPFRAGVLRLGGGGEGHGCAGGGSGVLSIPTIVNVGEPGRHPVNPP